MSLSVAQKGVLRGMLGGAGVGLTTIVLACVLNPFAFEPSLLLEQRLQVAAFSSLALAVLFGICIGRLAKHRFFNPEDIDGSGIVEGSARAKLLQALLQNTLEQSLLAAIVYFAWVLTMPTLWLSAVPCAAFAFFVGRLFFLIGYEKGAASRAFGFALTFYPTMLLLFVMLLRSLVEAI